MSKPALERLLFYPAIAVLLIISSSYTTELEVLVGDSRLLMNVPFSCNQITLVRLLHNYGKDSNCCWEQAEMGELQHSSQGKDHSDGEM